MLKADFHIHTKYSMDCSTALEEIIARCQATGINCINIADHDSVEGALQIQGMAPFKVIVAEEILTPHGEIMGMFLKERIPSGISVEEAISRIRAQDGLVCLPHPFDALRGLRLDSKKLAELAPEIDVIEVFNARSLTYSHSTQALAFAAKHRIPACAGSDAHTPGEIGSTYVEMPEFTGKDDFLEALLDGKIHQHQSSPLVHFRSVFARVRKTFQSGK